MSKHPGDRYVYRARHTARARGTAGARPARARFPAGIFEPQADSEESTASRAARYVIVVGAVGLTTMALWPVRETIGLLNIGLIFLIVIVASTIFAGRGAGILASVVGFALFDYFLVPPFLTFVISDLHNILALFVFLGFSVLISWLIAGARERARQAEQRANDVARLYELSQVVIGARTMEEVLPAIAKKVAEMLDAGVCWVLLPDEQRQLTVRTRYPDDARTPTRDEMAVASWAFSHGEDAGVGGQENRPFINRPARAPGLFAPLRAGQRTMGLLGVGDKRGGRSFTLGERTVLSTLADQTAVALERLRLLREAERAEVLARTDEMKSALMSAVSHDLRTPLSSIMTLVTGLLDTEIKWDESTQREFLTGIYEEAVRLNRIVGSVLDMSRIEGGALQPDKYWYNIGEVVQAVAQRLEPKLTHHPLSIRVEEDLPLVLFDFTEIDQVLTNLVENAAKYTPPGTPILVSARRAGNNLEVTVEDSGSGVQSEHLPHLFDKFYRAAMRREKGIKGGLGLGLAIARGFVEAHGGHIWAANRPEGGLRVTFTLPIEPALEPARGTASAAAARPT